MVNILIYLPTAAVSYHCVDSFHLVISFISSGEPSKIFSLKLLLNGFLVTLFAPYIAYNSALMISVERH